MFPPSCTKDTPFMQRVNSAHVMTHFVSLKKQTLHDVAKIIKFEKSPIFTQNLPYLDSAREKWLSCYRQARRSPARFLKPMTPGSLVGSEYSGIQTVPTSPRSSASPHVYQQRFSRSPPLQRYSNPTQTALEALAEVGYANITASDLSRLSPPDEFEEELQVMANVRAYFQVAHKVCSHTL
jgi:hypothetical protein